LPRLEKSGELDDPCRRVLIKAMAVGLFSSVGSAQAQGVFDPSFERSPGCSFHFLSGRVLVNDRLATLQTPVKPGDTVETAGNAKVAFVVANKAYILRGENRVTIEAPADNSLLKTLLRQVTGMFSRKATSVVIPTATMGIRN